MRFSFGTTEDAKEVLRLLELESYKGDLRIIFTRRDDPVNSLLMENDAAVTGVIRDSEDRVVATISVIPRVMYIGGELKNVAYITGFKRDHSYKNMINWKEVFARLDETGDYDVCICCFVGDNESVIKMLTKRRERLPYAIPVCKMDAFIINPKVKVKNPHPELQFSQVTASDEKEVISFVNEHGKRHDLFHKLDSVSDVKGLKAEDFYCLKRDGRVVAAAAIWNRQDVKQYILKECRGKMKLVRLLNPLLSALGYITIQPDNTKVNLAYVSFMEAENDDPELYTSLFCGIKEAAMGTYESVIVGTVVGTSKYAAFKKIRGLTFSHNIAQIAMNSINNKLPTDINGENADIEAALL